MLSERKSRRIGELGRVVTGKTPPTANAENFGGAYPFITIPDLNGRVFINTAERTLSEQGAKIMRSSLLPAGSVMMSCIATIGKCGITTKPSFTNQQINSVICNDDVEPRYLYYCFRELGEELESAGGGGSVYTNVSKSRFSEIEVELPALDEQRAIAHILGTLDDKIELNCKMNQTLEAMARAIFKSWFVDFDPVRAKAEGRDPGLPRELAALFPESFEDSELGDIPKGWTLRPFSEIVQIISGGTPKTAVAEYWDGNIPWFSVADAPDDRDVYVVNTDKKITQAGLDNSAAQLLPEGTTIITARGTVGKVALVGIPMTMNQSCYGLLGNESGPSFTYFATRTLVSLLKQHGHGSVFNTITRDTLAGVNFVSPPKRILEAFEPVVAPMMKRIKSNVIESRTLAALRDALLPKLLSGEIRVKEAKRFVDSVQIGLTGRVGRD